MPSLQISLELNSEQKYIIFKTADRARFDAVSIFNE